MPELPKRRSLLVHVAFHFVEARLQYLAEVLANFGGYDLDRIEVVIDTNSDDTARAVEALPVAAHVGVRVEVHRNLEHPFALTWAHRKAMPARRSEFDLFMYVEDDILVPWAAVSGWLETTDDLYARGFIRGFLRTECNPAGEIVASDWPERLQRPIARTIAGRKYVRPEFSYQAFWIYTAQQLGAFVKLRAWGELGLHRRCDLVRSRAEWWLVPESMRERAAFGLVFAQPGGHRLLLPLAADGQIDPECMVKHLPNTYALAVDGRLARFAVDTLLVDRPVPAGSLRSFAIEARQLAHVTSYRTQVMIRRNALLHVPARSISRALHWPGRTRAAREALRQLRARTPADVQGGAPAPIQARITDSSAGASMLGAVSGMR